MKSDDRFSMDFTQGNIMKHLIKFSIPLFLGNILQTLYNTVDSIWVGKFLGPSALAAVSVSFPIIFLLISLVMGITMATTVLVGQYKGAQNYFMIRKTVNTSMFLLTISALVISVAGILLNKLILKLMNTPVELMEIASGYLNIILAGLIFTFAYNAVSAILRGLGDSKTPLVFLFYTTVINIILDPVFIFGIGPIPKMGVNGAALATVISQAISFFLAANYLNKNNHLFSINIRDFHYDKDITVKILKIGLPSGIQQTVVSIGMTAMMAIINTFGSLVVAAWGAASKIDSFAFLPSMSVGLATSSISAQNIGAGKYERVEELLKWASLLSLLISGTITLMIFTMPKLLLSMFTNDINVLMAGAGILKILGVSYIPFGFMWVTNGIIRGAGATFIPMVISIISLWLIRIPLAYYLSFHTALKSNGIWVAISVSAILSTLLSYAYYLSGKWKKRVIEEEVNEIKERLVEE
ncbi:MATE family efflux transporter [Thermovenabulum gondwanense]|uniref:Probable multidrug resistance protein NorM n=1 Tax=Thermovenabulum gondwanense TaxID=520767 RepID=A0A162MY52_9FIRM|nr:MATE family efflux transporter [Thermovenabulum gondwanense]KYO68100.1 Multidrug export protein MepA [Thermovenabulum gondwanense]